MWRAVLKYRGVVKRKEIRTKIEMFKIRKYLTFIFIDVSMWPPDSRSLKFSIYFQMERQKLSSSRTVWHFQNEYHNQWTSRGLVLGRGFVPVTSSSAVKSLGLGGTRTKNSEFGFRVRELKTRTKNALWSHIKVGRFVRNY